MRRLLSVALASSLVFGCGDSFSPGGVSGAYNLQSVNGQNIPSSETVTQGGFTFTVEITSGTLRLNSDNTWSVSVTSSITSGGTTLTDTSTESGTFTLVEPSTIRFTDSDGDTFAGTWDGDTITIIDNGDSLVFRK